MRYCIITILTICANTGCLRAPDTRVITTEIAVYDDFPDGDYVLEFDRSRGLFFISSDLNPFQKGQEKDHGKANTR